MAVNFAGPAELTRLLLPDLAREQSAQVVFVTSGLAFGTPAQLSGVLRQQGRLAIFRKILAGSGASRWRGKGPRRDRCGRDRIAALDPAIEPRAGRANHDRALK